MTVHDILNESTKALEAVEIPSARLDAEVLLSFCLGCDRLEFYKNPDMVISETQLAAFRNLIARRLQWEPVAYITGRKEFWTFVLEVNSSVLIPRPDTEVIVEETLEVAKKYESPLNEQPQSNTGSVIQKKASDLDSGLRRNDEKPRKSAPSVINILDIGTGCGAIAIALALEITCTKIVATDISEAALSLAQKNTAVLGLQDKIYFRQGNLFEPVEGIFDIIVCNPPYISAREYEKLPAGVKNYEPQDALLAGKSGLEFYEKLIYQAAGFLQKNGWLLLEIGAKQESGVRGITEAAGFYDSIEMRRDYAGLPRVIKARRKISG
jgi:release factor glutamine methyltransferase